MEHFFDLPVVVNGEEKSISCRLVTFGYAYKYHLVIDKQELIFERDDEMNFRAINYNHESNSEVSKELLVAIIHSLQKLSS